MTLQLELLNDQYQVPLLLLRPVIAIPVSVLSASVTLPIPPAPAKPIRLDTAMPTAPRGVAASSLTAMAGDFVASSTGASLRPVTVSVRRLVELSPALPLSA